MALLVLSLLTGVVTGSFLGHCIFWLPRGGSILKPVLSYCACQKSVVWRHRIPLLSWLWWRGRCHECGQPISAQYPLVEAITGAFFATACWRFGFPLVIPVWIFGAVLIVTTFIDIEFFLIPDIVSKPAIVAGIASSLLFPELHATSSGLIAAGLSIMGALIGGGLLFLIGELGKLAFGRYKVVLPDPVPFRFENTSADDAQIVIGNDKFRCSDHFFRKSDRIRIRAEEVIANDQKFQAAELSLYYDHVETPAGIIPLTDLYLLEGRTAYAEFPREAMGLGDVKLVIAIGTFAGWAGAIFTIPAASVIASLFGIATLVIGRREWSSKIPFGPYLAIGAVVWIFCGREIVRVIFGF
jgi:leader peptidase (prepilin peptidase) / N-methyltransferase